eukprot:TRINITY_DN1760_c1_g1_i1.p1 TRINITY_DN1760_c1_g1~~TRINITY_DN1760_c1_g1_i1.p1  ORF type:complete len:475 (-),score=68.95 TRINITY_DN1760_c1_g1_i1:66-1457(-)
MLVWAAMVAAALGRQAPDRATCQRVERCNGEMCANVCLPGTVEVDPWAAAALRFQRTLQRNNTLLRHEMIGTHNGYQSQALGYGLEEEWCHQLFLADGYTDDSYVVLSNQRYSATDLLNLGVRHFEIDIWWVPLLEGIRLCHDPARDPRFVKAVNDSSMRVYGRLPDWNPTQLGCYADFNRGLIEGLREIDAWLTLPQNTEEFIILYYDTKFTPSPEIVLEAVEPLYEVFGPRLFTNIERETLFPTRWPTLGELFGLGKQIMVENNADIFLAVDLARDTIFTPTSWSSSRGGSQFGFGSFSPFPACTVNNQFYYNLALIRGLDGSISKGPVSQSSKGLTESDMQQLWECGVNTVGVDQMQADYMPYFVWSWAPGQPTGPGCTVMNSEGRWEITDCNLRLRHACQVQGTSEDDDTKWVLSATTSPWAAPQCPQGAYFAAPTTGYANSVVRSVAAGSPVWLAHQE